MHRTRPIRPARIISVWLAWAACALCACEGALAEPATIGAALVEFQVRRDVPLQEANPKFCWFHPRAAAVPGAGRDGQPAVVLTLQKHLEADDHYSGLYFMRTDDLGQSWRGPIEVPELAWGQEPGGVTVAVCDVTPGWHAPSGKVLAIGAQIRYDAQGRHLRSKPRSAQTAYAVYDPKTDQWSKWQVLRLPADAIFDYALSACAQWLVQADGTLLVPLYFAKRDGLPFSVTVAQCGFDGRELTYRRHGNVLSLEVERGLCEPSLIFFGGRYYLTIRNDVKGYVTTSPDGLRFDPIKPWTFDDGSELGSYNTQQHWLAHGNGLFLCYTRRGAQNDHIPRNRAPLFIAQVDPERLCLLRRTEQVLIPERGLMLGNFGAAAITAGESWVTDAEFVSFRFNQKPSAKGGDGSVFVARVLWPPPIVTVGKALYKKHARPREAPLVSVQYVGAKLERREVQAVETVSDVGDNIVARWSADNGRTWSDFVPVQPSNNVVYQGVTVWEGEGCSVFHRAAGVLVQLWLRQINVGGVYHCFTYTRFSRDQGRTWSPAQQLRYEEGDPFDPKEAKKASFLDHNEGYPGNNILVRADGTLVVCLAHANAPGDPKNRQRPWRMGSALFTGKWSAARQDYEWTPGARVEISPEHSARGLMEPEVAELKDGRLLVVWRGSTHGWDGTVAKMPGRKFFSVSADGGRTLTAPAPWNYDDGTGFHSPSSIHRMIRHSRTGKLYWLGNICPSPPVGNSPRYPLVIAEVDESKAALKKGTVTVIDDRQPGQGDIQFSNFSLLEDRQSGALELHLTTYGQEPDPKDWATADNYKYTLRLVDPSAK